MKEKIRRVRLSEGQVVGIKGKPIGILNIWQVPMSEFPVSRNPKLFSKVEGAFELRTGFTFKRVKRDIWMVLNRRGGHLWMLFRRKDLEPL